jgi:hypothetical protein
MPNQLQDETKRVTEEQKQQMNAKIGGQVMSTLGQPSGLHGTQVRLLWKDHYRVNVLVGLDAVSAKVAHSYFLVADSDGNVITSTPKIKREYRPSKLPTFEPVPGEAVAPQLLSDPQARS